jgi:hypothetical protein
MDGEAEDTQSITTRDLLEKRIGALAIEGSASLLSRGASRAARSSIGHSRARMRVERDAMGKRAGTYND